MSESHDLKFSNWVLIAPLIAVLAIWTIFWSELLLKVNFNEYGIYPRTLKGLRGIIGSPFIHGSLAHLYNNTVPLAFLLASLFYFYRSIAFRILGWGILWTGLITWIIARPSYHIGASGVIYLLASFIFFKGVFTKHYRLVAVSLIVVFMYGGMLWYIFPVKEEISWEGHLAGFVSGLVLALAFKVKVMESKKFDWEKEDYNEAADEFLNQFDSDGNFIAHKVPDHPEDEVKIVYHYKMAPKDGDGKKGD